MTALDSFRSGTKYLIPSMMLLECSENPDLVGVMWGLGEKNPRLPDWLKFM